MFIDTNPYARFLLKDIFNTPHLMVGKCHGLSCPDACEHAPRWRVHFPLIPLSTVLLGSSYVANDFQDVLKSIH
jgi:hypothetical protein